MKKISLATKILTVAILTVPFVYEKEDNLPCRIPQHL